MRLDMRFDLRVNKRKIADISGSISGDDRTGTRIDMEVDLHYGLTEFLYHGEGESLRD
jgi:hypothetical protein